MSRAVLFALLAVPVTPLQAASDPGQTAQGFLAVYGSFHPSDGVPDAQGRSRLAPYLSPGLNKLLGDAAVAEARFAAKVKSSPPLIEGDLFTSMFEGASQWKLGTCGVSANTARCPVAYSHRDSSGKALSWTDTLLLVKEGEDWRVDDIAYGGGFQFGNTGRLSDTLKLVLREAP
jgi:hypothetical protein